MNEEKPTENQPKEEPKTDELQPDVVEQINQEPDESQKLIDEANAAAERLEKANKQLEANVKHLQNLNVKSTFAGQAEAGKQGKSDDEKKQESARKVLEGTGLEDYAFPKET